MLLCFMTIWNILRPTGIIFTANWYNLWPFGIVCGHLVYFLRFGMFGPRKIWQPCLKDDLCIGCSVLLPCPLFSAALN
jgi:hypothetical protein